MAQRTRVVEQYLMRCVLAVWWGMAASATAQSSCGMQHIGTLGGSSSAAYAASEDGSVVVGGAVDAALQYRAFRWSVVDGMQNLGTLGGPHSSRATGVSADGSVVVGVVQINPEGHTRAFLWTIAGGMQDLGTLGGNWSHAYGVSADGSTVVGEAFNTAGVGRAFKWTIAGGMQDLGTLGGDWSIARGVSADGSIVVGEASNASDTGRAFLWSTSGGMLDLGTLGGSQSLARGVSADGAVVVGEARNASEQRRGFRWTVIDGMQDLGSLGGNLTRAAGVSADGEVIVGESRTTAGLLRAFRWTVSGGIQDLGTLGGLDSRAFGTSGDGMLAIGEAANATNQVRAFRWGGDTDGDGLLDDWECNGIPYLDAAGISQRYILDADGDGISDANWLKKDIFVEVDAMSGRGPAVATLQRVVAAFDPPDRVLVPAVEGVPGAEPNIALHIHMHAADSSLSLTQGGDYTLGTNGFGAFSLDKALYFGSPTERSHPDREGILEAKRKAYRYCIFANTYNGGTSSGVAEGIPSDDFMVTLGAFPIPGGSPDQQAATFMHELGHTLGLRHGGSDDILWKPNYYSVMNYWWQLPKAWQGNAWGLRFSEAQLPTLDENMLDESVGVGASRSGVSVPYRVDASSMCQGVQCGGSMPTVCYNLASLAPGASVDWDGDCVTASDSVSADINDFSDRLPASAGPDLRAAWGLGRAALVGHHDWLQLRYDFRGTPTYAPGAPAENIECDYDASVSTFLDEILPECVADLSGASDPSDPAYGVRDGVLDLSDFFYFLDQFVLGNLDIADLTGSTDPVDPDYGEPDGIIDASDFFYYLDLFVAGCP